MLFKVSNILADKPGKIYGLTRCAY